MNDENELIRRLNFENLVWIVFILVAVVDIYGDELIKRGVRENDIEVQKKAKNLFLLVALVSVIVYVYFFYRNYADYKKYNNKLYEIRLTGSSLVLIGTLCLIYFLLYNDEKFELPSNI